MANDSTRNHCKVANHAPFFFLQGKTETKKPLLYHVVQRILFDAYKSNKIPYKAFQRHIEGVSSVGFRFAIAQIQHHALAVMIDADKVKAILANMNVLPKNEAKKDVTNAILLILLQCVEFPYESFISTIAEDDGVKHRSSCEHTFEMYNMLSLFFLEGYFSQATSTPKPSRLPLPRL